MFMYQIDSLAAWQWTLTYVACSQWIASTEQDLKKRT